MDEDTKAVVDEDSKSSDNGNRQKEEVGEDEGAVTNVKKGDTPEMTLRRHSAGVQPSGMPSVSGPQSYNERSPLLSTPTAAAGYKTFLFIFSIF